MILTLARTIQIGGLENNSGAWLKEVVGGIMQNTPHAWPSHTRENFPQPLIELMSEYPAPKVRVANCKKIINCNWAIILEMKLIFKRISRFFILQNYCKMCLY